MFDFLKFARDHRLSYLTEGHHHCHAGWVQTHCPLCTDGRHGWHLGFSLSKGSANCWRCGPLKIVDAVRALARVSPDKAWEILRKYGGGKAVEAQQASLRREEVVDPPGLGPLTKQHLRYLKSRGLPESLVEEWSLQGTRHLSGLWNWRVCFPIRNELNETVAWGGRSVLPDAKPKYKLSDDADCVVDPKTMLYGAHKAGDAVIVVEGPGDVWNIGPGAVATLGIDWRPAQAHLLRKYKRRFIMFDPEPLAQKRAQKLADWVSLFPGETEIIDDLPSDPGSLDRRLVRKVRRLLLKDGG